MKNKNNPAQVRYVAMSAITVAYFPLFYCYMIGATTSPAAVQEALQHTLAGQAVFLLSGLISMILLMVGARQTVRFAKVVARRTSGIRKWRLPSWVVGSSKDEIRKPESFGDYLETGNSFALGLLISSAAAFSLAAGAYMIQEGAPFMGGFLSVVAAHASVLSKTTGIAGNINLVYGKAGHQLLKRMGRVIADTILSIVMPRGRTKS